MDGWMDGWMDEQQHPSALMAPPAQTLITCLLCLLCTVSPAEVSDQQEVSPGQDAPLRCRAPTGASVRLLEWSRTDLKERGYVFFYRNRRSYENYQLPSFRGRVELRDPEMEDGDVSVVLKNVSAEDAGGYECRVLTHSGTTPVQTRQIVELTVTDSAGNIWTSGVVAGYVTVVLSVIGGLFILSICVICSVKCAGRCPDGEDHKTSPELPNQEEQRQSTGSADSGQN